MRGTSTGRRLLAASVTVAVFAGFASLQGCATTGRRVTASTKLIVVAAENVWGSIARALGGDKVEVASLIDNPATDPHDYEPTAADARAVAMARLVIVNGIGYDAWASKLVATNPATGREVINVGKLVGAGADANPHRWYNPADVHAVVTAVAAALAKADPGDADYFAAQRQNYETSALAGYDALIARIKSQYAGTPVGTSESIFAMLAPALGLKVLTPSAFQRAISEGTDPTATDKATIDAQIKKHEIKVYVYNTQNATPDVRAQIAEAKAAGIPVTAITETIVPSSASFTTWQEAQLRALADALRHGAAT